MTWSTPRLLNCEQCGTQVERKNPAKCGNGLLLCPSCKGKCANKRFEERHGASRFERYYQGNATHTTYQRKWKLEKRYGMTMEEYDKLLENQGGVCAICKNATEGNLVVDHDHATNKVRGLLCHPCNRSLGQMKDSVSTLQAAIQYLQRTDGERSWDDYFLQIAALVSTRSKDPSTQVGAVLVRDRTILSTGYNGFPRGVNDDVPERHARPLKYTWTVHAEENCLLAAARNGVRTEGSSLYVTPLFTCSRCATSVVQAGVREVVSSDHLKDHPRWREDFAQSMLILKEAGVLVRTPRVAPTVEP